jgi:Acetyltransferase (GNAT) domain
MNSTIETTLLQSSTLPQILSTTDVKWQQCLAAMPHDFYHLSGYLELEARRQNATPEAILIQDGDRLFFLPYLLRDCYQLLNTANTGYQKIYDVISPYGYPGILVNPAAKDRDFIIECLNAVYEYWQQQHICAAFLRLHPLLNDNLDPSISGDKFTVCHQGDVVICDLTIDPDLMWQQRRKNHRTRIKKLRKTGFTPSMVNIDRYLDTFIDIYRETMNRVHANQSYYYPREYFRNLVDVLGDRIQLCAVELEGKIVAACLVTEVCGTIQYHLGGTLTEYLPQAPTTMMLDYIIEWGRSRNDRYLNLGGGLGGSQDSLYHFKAGFSDLSKPFMTVKSIVNNEIYDHLTCLKSESSGMALVEIQRTTFFPAYSLN